MGRQRRGQRVLVRLLRVAAWVALPFVVILAILSWRDFACSPPPPAPPTAPAQSRCTQPGEELIMISRPNHLSDSTSPYLLQHARNPVDWYPWGQQAFELARRQDKPIFLSVGYSTCHWCHVMAHESFEDEQVAELLNEHFVPVKVDREQRPDVDDIYMHVTQMLTGRGGWPNSVFLTPDGRPWFAGTYFPPEDRFGQPSFRRVLTQLAEAWRHHRADVEAQADQLASALDQVARGGELASAEAPATPNRRSVAHACEALRRNFDQRHGGFGGPPKFPPHQSLALLLYEHRRSGDLALLQMATVTLDGLARGGIRDHVGGGFHRYAVDNQWFLPHFEKMLYDNAQLARIYAQAYELTGEQEYAQVARETFEWILRDLADQAGPFHSAYDADSEGVEGKFYVWTRQEILDTLGHERGQRFCRAYGVLEEGNWRDEATGHRSATNILHQARPPEALAAEEELDVEQLRRELRDDREELRRRREQRVWPGRDDKVLTAWNGLMIGALAVGARVLREERYIDAARRAAMFILGSMRPGGRLRASYRAGAAQLNAYLDDYAFLADGLLDLHQTTGEDHWLDAAGNLTDGLIEHYWDDQAGGFYFTSDDHEELLVRMKNAFDHAIPSGNGVAAGVLTRLAIRTGEPRYSRLAERTFQAFGPFMQRVPHGTESLLLALALFQHELTPAEPAPAGGPEARPPGQQPDAAGRQPPLSVEVFASALRLPPGAPLNLAVRLRIDENYHVNSHQPRQDYLTPTSVVLEPPGPLRVQGVSYPKGQDWDVEFQDRPLSVYRNEHWVTMRLSVAPDGPPGPAEAVLAVHFQACDERRCLAPQTLRLPLPLEIDPDAPPDQDRHREIFQRIT